METIKLQTENSKMKKLKDALKQIAEVPDCLYKSDAEKMRKIAKEALKNDRD